MIYHKRNISPGNYFVIFFFSFMTCACLCSFIMVQSKYLQHKQFLWKTMRAIIFFGRGIPNLQKVGVNKIVTPYFGNETLWHHHAPPPYPLNRLNYIEIILFEQNKHTICDHLVTPYILVIKNVMTTHLFFFPQIYDPQYIWDPPPFEEKDSPLRSTDVERWSLNASWVFRWFFHSI